MKLLKHNTPDDNATALHHGSGAVVTHVQIPRVQLEMLLTDLAVGQPQCIACIFDNVWLVVESVEH